MMPTVGRLKTRPQFLEVAAARRLPRIGISVAGHRLERIAGPGPVMAVIDDQRQPLLARKIDELQRHRRIPVCQQRGCQ